MQHYKWSDGQGWINQFVNTVNMSGQPGQEQHSVEHPETHTAHKHGGWRTYKGSVSGKRPTEELTSLNKNCKWKRDPRAGSAQLKHASCVPKLQMRRIYTSAWMFVCFIWFFWWLHFVKILEMCLFFSDYCSTDSRSKAAILNLNLKFEFEIHSIIIIIIV